ncbi:spore protease YyaC [Paenibacillus daejeonensis]|uniref:spore protease YyaC n=1 Tax=Paenibacillus daejeonensis TaxID=135193 RepID=UPI001B7FD561|nr:spore protease YyaC [Paenibacillus daejeonensis]
MMHHIHYLDKSAPAFLADKLVEHAHSYPDLRQIVIVGIGTNRSPGDSLGPAVNSLLANSYTGNRRIRLFGTLEKPVHALNLKKTLTYLNKKHAQAYTIALDACLGQYFKIGTIQLVHGPLMPGLSMGKQLPEIGHIHLKGIVNNYGPINVKVLDKTSLTFVQDMALMMAQALTLTIDRLLPTMTDVEHDSAGDTLREDLLASSQTRFTR